MIDRLSTAQLVAGVLIALSAALLLYRAGARRTRLRGAAFGTRRHGSRRSLPWTRLAAALAGVAVAALIPGWTGLLVGVVVGCAVDRVVRRMEPRAARQQRERARAALPYAVDLTAAMLSSGAPPAMAAREVGAAVGGLLGARLGEVGNALALGATPDQAWTAPLGGVPNGQRFAAVMVRSSETGAALARSLRRLADDLRSAGLAELEAATHRAGVLVVLPLGFCFLPAFVAGGLIPVVVSMLSTVLP